jgi:preprotein translocase subunit SecE
MNTKAENQPTALDAAKLTLAIAVVIGSIVGYYYYADYSSLLRTIGLLIGFALAVVIAMQSVQGRELWKFIQGSRMEMRKVVWPTREEAIQTTIAVLIFALLMGVFFWLLDLFLLWVTRMITAGGG